MLRVHTNKDGNKTLIAQLSDDELIAVITTALDKIIVVKGAASTTQLDPYMAALYGVKMPNPQELGKKVREHMNKLYPYLAEAYLRNIDSGIREKLEQVAARSTSLDKFPALPATTELADDFDEEPQKSATMQTYPVTYYYR